MGMAAVFLQIYQVAEWVLVAFVTLSPLSPLHSAVSTFWMANPNNNLINCSAAGSEVRRYASIGACGQVGSGLGFREVLSLGGLG